MFLLVRPREVWTGQPKDGFLHLKAPDPTDTLGHMHTAFCCERFIEGIPMICETDELQAMYPAPEPLVHPGGWPQWLAEYLDRFATVCVAQTGLAPMFMLTDPVPNIEDIRYNRFCPHVPDGQTPEYLAYLAARRTPCTIGVWGGRNYTAEAWRYNLNRVKSAGFPWTILVEAGQPVAPIKEAFGDELDHAQIFVFYYEPQLLPKAVETVQQLKEAR